MGNGVWILIGIVVGILIEIGVEYVKTLLQSKKNIKNLKFEINMNIKKINGFLDIAMDFRNKINADCLQTFYGYFHLSNTIFVTANSLFYTGELYNILPDVLIGKLQDNASFLSLQTETWLNAQIQGRKNEISNLLNNPQVITNRTYIDIKQDAVRNVDWYEIKLKECKTSFEEILKKL